MSGLMENAVRNEGWVMHSEHRTFWHGPLCVASKADTEGRFFFFLKKKNVSILCWSKNRAVSGWSAVVSMGRGAKERNVEKLTLKSVASHESGPQRS